jgi:PAS domain S-box-containing protein
MARSAARSGRPERPLAAENAELRAELERLRPELERRRESERMYRFSAEIGGRLVWSTDPDGRVIAMSRVFKSLMGIDDEEVLKRRWMEAIHPEDRREVVDRWADCLRTGDPFSAEFRALLPDGTTRFARRRRARQAGADPALVRLHRGHSPGASRAPGSARRRGALPAGRPGDQRRGVGL